MTINSVSEGLNGVQVKCIDRESSESATTTIRIVDARGMELDIHFALSAHTCSIILQMYLLQA